VRFGRGGSAVFSALAGVIQRIAQIAVALLIMPLLINALGKSSFGIWAAAASVTWMGAILDLGVGGALVTILARMLAAGQTAPARRLVTTALWLGAMIAVVELCGALLIIPRIAPAEAAEAYQLAVVVMALNVPVNLAAALWAGAQRLYMVWAWESLQTLLTGVTIWALVSQTSDVRSYVAASAGAVLAANCVSLAHFMRIHPHLRPHLALPSAAEVGGLLLQGAPYLLLGLGAFLAVSSDNLVALSVLGGDGAAVMALSQRICLTALGLLTALTQPLWPAFANAATQGDSRWIKKSFRTGTFVVMLAAALGSGFIIMFGGKAVDIWLGGKVTLEPEIFWAMAVWIVIPALGRVPDVLLNALGIVWFQVKVAVVFGLLAFALKLLFASAYGAPGILAATGVAYGCTHLPAYLWWVRRWARET
jgi:O-antigen/teichoic acid export membrane protein